MSKQQWGHGYHTGYEEGQSEIMSKLVEFIQPTYPLYKRWGRFFDKIGWKYQYRPFKANTWTPIFILQGADSDILVDVRYGTSQNEFIEIAEREVRPNIQNTPYEENEILFLTSAIFPSAVSFNDFPAIGWLDDETCGIDEAILNYYNGCYGFFHASGSWRDRITGLYDGDHLLSPPDKKTVLRLWNTSEMAGYDGYG